MLKIIIDTEYSTIRINKQPFRYSYFSYLGNSFKFGILGGKDKIIKLNEFKISIDGETKWRNIL